MLEVRMVVQQNVYMKLPSDPKTMKNEGIKPKKYIKIWVVNL